MRLYDLTSTDVEGAAPKNPMLRGRYSRDHRGDCLQVVLAVIVNVDGFPLSDETFDGDRTDVTTLGTIMWSTATSSLESWRARDAGSPTPQADSTSRATRPQTPRVGDAVVCPGREHRPHELPADGSR